MRIKKPFSKENQDITFNTITERNEAMKALFDGDLVKVLNASDDPQIKSGWAVYRFCFETQTFDLVEQEEKAMGLAPDGKTTTLSTKDADGQNKIISPDLLNIFTPDFEILEDFDFDIEVKYWGGKNILRFTPKGLGTDSFMTIPVNTTEGKRFIYLGQIDLTNVGFDDKLGVAHWLVSAKLKDTDGLSGLPLSYGYNADGGCFEFDRLYNGTDTQIPLFVYRAEMGNQNGFNTFNNKHIFKFWKKNVKIETEPTLKPDFKTTFLGAKQSGSEVNSIIAPFLHEWYNGIEFLQDFDFTFSFQNGTDPLLRYTPVGIKSGDYSLRIPANTNAGKKWLVVGAGALSFRFDKDTKKAVWIIGARLQDTDVNAWAQGASWVMNDGSINLPAVATEGTTVGESIPFMIVSADIPENWSAFNVHTVKTVNIWQKYLKEPAASTAHGFKSYANYILANNDKLNLKDGQFIKVLDASLDIRVGSVIWAVYRWDEANKQLVIMSVEDSTPESKTFGTIAVRDGLKASCVDNELVKVVDATADPEVSEGWAFYRYSAKYKTFDLVSKKPTAGATPARIYPDGYTIDEYDINDGERPTFAVIDAMKSFRNDQILLEDFDYEISYIDYSDSFFFTPSKEGKVPILINGVQKYLVLAKGGFKRNLLPADCKTAYVTVTATVVDTINDATNTIGCGYSGDGCHQIRPRSDVFNSNIVLFQARVAVPPLGGQIDKQSIYMSKYWKRALNVGAIPTSDINTIERSQTDLFSNQFSVPDAMHSFRQDMQVLKDFDFEFTHDKVTKIITMSLRGGGNFKAIPVLIGGVRKFMHLQTSTFDLNNLHYSVTKRFHFAVSAAIRDTDVFGNNGMTNQYDGNNGSVVDVKPRATDTSVVLFQFSGNVPAFDTQMTTIDFVIHKYWKKALAPFNELYAEMMA